MSVAASVAQSPFYWMAMTIVACFATVWNVVSAIRYNRARRRLQAELTPSETQAIKEAIQKEEENVNKSDRG